MEAQPGSPGSSQLKTNIKTTLRLISRCASLERIIEVSKWSQNQATLPCLTLLPKNHPNLKFV